MFWTIAKVFMLAFWALALANLLAPFGSPWEVPLNAIAGVTLVLHLVEMLLFNKYLQQQPAPGLHRLQVLLFGVLHLQRLH
ncbi:DUF1145 domain-containing protein [Pseudomonas mangrovi]|uniref:DUF1145 domain-containing protein n=1 Tax=Pseudomonas mangrovi TaxID=2161748 RepID=A0A2T5PEG9_9PSED|nr:DUF1145 domain-containing protein [Pseudomonas mangrovi]PTU76135.1 hypothetical protein DBO85_00400 [Pseudomonas mangrovi]